ncbi:MAG TPA: hypothetical protein VMV88_07495 [Gallionella sp.]|nr:hypothetical protein [Gallionella sp.]
MMRKNKFCPLTGTINLHGFILVDYTIPGLKPEPHQSVTHGAPRHAGNRACQRCKCARAASGNRAAICQRGVNVQPWVSDPAGFRSCVIEIAQAGHTG